MHPSYWLITLARLYHIKVLMVGVPKKSIRMSVYLFVCLSGFLSAGIYICIPICLCPSVFCVCLSLCLCLSVFFSLSGHICLSVFFVCMF